MRKEDFMDMISRRMNERENTIQNLRNRLTALINAQKTDAIRYEEANLLKDIRDGRVNLVHAETGKTINVHVFKNPA